MLWPKGSGSAGSPNIIDAYDTGAKPLIAGNGSSEAVYLYNQEYWEIRNLEVTNQGATAANRRGVYVKLEDYGTGHYYRIINLTVHDVNGDNTKDLGGSTGIAFDVVGNGRSNQIQRRDHRRKRGLHRGPQRHQHGLFLEMPTRSQCQLGTM